MAITADDIVFRYTGSSASASTSRGGQTNAGPSGSAFNIPLTGLLNLWDKVLDSERLNGAYAGSSPFEYRSFDVCNIHATDSAIDVKLEMILLSALGHQPVPIAYFVETNTPPSSVASTTISETQSPSARYGMTETWVDFNANPVGGANLIQLRGRSRTDPTIADAAGTIAAGNYCRVWVRRRAPILGADRETCLCNIMISAE